MYIQYWYTLAPQMPIRMVQDRFNADFNTESLFNFWVCSNNANHHSRVLSIESDARHWWLRSDAVFCPTLASCLTFRTTALPLLCREGWPHSCCVNFNLKKSASYSCCSFNCWLGIQSLHPQVTRWDLPTNHNIVLGIAPLLYYRRILRLRPSLAYKPPSNTVRPAH